MKRMLIGLCLLGLFATAWGTGGQESDTLGTAPAERETPTIVVASKIDTEGALIGQMIVQLLRENGAPVEDRTEFGTTDVIRAAIINGEIDIYPEYTGNGGFFYPDSPEGVWKNAERGWETVKRLDEEAHGLIWLTPASANNTWAIAVRNDLAEQEELRTLEDLARYMNDGGEVKLAGSEEFVSRPDALPAFEEAYGLTFQRDQLLVLSGGNTATTAQAAANRTDGVNAAMAYGTDGQLQALGLRVLEDTLGVQPVYQPAPLVRREILEAYPEMESLLEPVFLSLDLETLQKLNARIAVQGEAASEVAADYLRTNGFLP